PVQHCATLSSMCCTTRPGGGGGFLFLPFCSFSAARAAAAPGGAICKWGLFSHEQLRTRKTLCSVIASRRRSNPGAVCSDVRRGGSCWGGRPPNGIDVPD